MDIKYSIIWSSLTVLEMLNIIENGIVKVLPNDDMHECNHSDRIIRATNEIVIAVLVLITLIEN